MLLDHSFSFSNCITYALCTSPLQVENCTVKYSTNSSYPDSSPHTTGPLNSSFQLPLLRRLTVYYHEAIISRTSCSSVIVRKQFKTGDCKCLKKTKKTGCTLCLDVQKNHNNQGLILNKEYNWDDLFSIEGVEKQQR